MTIYVPKENLLLNTIVKLNQNKSNYLWRVMRCKEGDILQVIDGHGGRYEAKIISITSKEVSISLTKQLCLDNIYYNSIIFQAILKGQSMDNVIREVVECGIKEVYPIITERTIVRDTNKINRWKSIAEEATEQSGRSHIPIIHEPISFEAIINIVNKSRKSCKILFHTTGSDLQAYLNECFTGEDIFFIIGPEGGLTPKEIDFLTNNDFEKISIGRFTLKSETIAPIATTLIHYFLDKKSPNL